MRVQVSGEREETAVYDALARAYEKDNPDVEVEVVKVADKDDHLAKLTTSFAAGNPPDVFLVNFREYSQFVTRGAVEPIDPHLESMGISKERYYKPPIEAFTYDGRLQCMPQNISSLVVYYNEELFRRSGLRRPRPGWTWEDFRETAITLTRGDVRGLGIEPNIIRIAPFVWSNGGDIVDDLESPSGFTLDEPAARRALEFIVGLVRDAEVVPTETEVAAQDLETRFVNGKLGMLLSSRRETPVLREVLGLEWDVAPLPVAKEPAGILHSDAYCVARGTEQLDEALDLVAFATGEEGQTITALSGRTVPSLESVSRSAAFLDPSQPPRHPEVFLDGIDSIRRTPVIPTWPEIEDQSEEILTRAYYEPGYTIEDAIEELDAQTTALFEEAARP
ncbi:MAG: ABC transporter substrate-binding protein [Actinomycetota bacterium]